MTARVQWFWLNRRMMINAAGSGACKESSHAIGQPERRKDVLHRVGQRPGNPAFGYHQRDFCRHPVFSPVIGDTTD